jgi:hypothetical protein
MPKVIVFIPFYTIEHLQVIVLSSGNLEYNQSNILFSKIFYHSII